MSISVQKISDFHPAHSLKNSLQPPFNISIDLLRLASITNPNVNVVARENAISSED
jgi:hypothetical protein